MTEELLGLIEREVLGWPGVWKKTDENGPGGVGVTGYRLGRRQIGHVHHNGLADFQFPKALHDQLIQAGRAKPHPAGFPAVVSRYVRTPEDVPAAVELFRINYERAKQSAEQRKAPGE